MLALRKAFLILGLLPLVNVVQASPMVLDADHFTVAYDTDQLGPYSQGLVSGSQDTVYFLSSSFKAMTPGGQGAPGAQLQLTLTIDPGYTFAGLSFVERGNYYLLGNGAVDVETSVTLANPNTADSATLALIPGSPLDTLQNVTSWELGGTLGPLGAGSPQTLLITLDSTLFASAPTGIAFIQNTYAGFQVATESAAVPEPTSWTLLLAGMLAAMLAGRRVRVPGRVRRQ